MTRRRRSNPWWRYDQWEARDRTLLEAVAIAREAAIESERGGYVVFEEYGTRATPGTFLRDALDTVLHERYRATPPDQEPP